ncbi:type II secretion system protein GspH [Lampropedia aestuarii]|uniref:Type II secretion system protein H n=1 Tax=Lampropedia aestuarii TaxID=2562762 RepID=A0A4S5BXP8_9BURK|nr:type II secretion system protein GspH [Lampropedia aestuarii]
MSTVHPASSSRGFTLLEILVVIAIAGLMSALIPLAYSRINEGAQYRDAVRSLWTSLRTLREEAQTTGATTQLLMDTQAKQFNFGSQTYQLPDDLEVRATVANMGGSPNTASIWFLPEGGSTGGSIEIIRLNGDGTRLRVDWLTGDITQEALLR